MNVALNVAQVTHAGGRETNEDALGSAARGGLACFAVSDGVGGQHGGEVAARIVVDTVTGEFTLNPACDPCSLRSYIEAANTRVAARKAEERGLAEMAATAAVLLIDQMNRLALWAHMGDTRIYLFRDGRLHSVTKDHSLVQQMVDAGYCKAAQLRTHPMRNALCQAIDGDGDRSADVMAAPLPIQAGDRFLLCTDGFWEWITEEDMEEAAAAADSAAQWLAKLQALVETNGSRAPAPADNYTAFAIGVDASGLAP
jgi:serine/threonine protein phosphatase PrpC